MQIPCIMYKYTIKVINTEKRKKAVTRQLHHFTGLSQKANVLRFLAHGIKNFRNICTSH